MASAISANAASSAARSLRKRESIDRAAPGRARRLAAQQIAQPVKFENVFRGARHVFLASLPMRRAACKSRGQKLRGLRGSGRLVHQRIARLAPARRVAALDFAHAIQNRLPEIAEHDERALLHRFLVQHFPNDGEFHERARAALACDVAVAEAHEFKQALLPGRHARFFLHPAIRARRGKNWTSRRARVRRIRARRATRASITPP